MPARLMAGLVLLLAGCAAPVLPDKPVSAADMSRIDAGTAAQDLTFIGGANATERTAFRRRAGGLWDEVSVPDGAVRFTFEVTGVSSDAIRLTDPSRNDGLSLIFNMKRKVIELQESPGEAFYDRYTIVAAY